MDPRANKATIDELEYLLDGLRVARDKLSNQNENERREGTRLLEVVGQRLATLINQCRDGW